MEFFDIVIHPKERMPLEKKNADAKEAAKAFALVGIVVGLGLGILAAFIGSIASPFLGGMATGLGLAAIIVFPIVFAILAVIGSAISSGIVWVIARVLGGTGTFAGNYYLASRLLWPLFFAGIIVGIVAMIPLLGWLIQLLWFLYVAYLSITMISIANTISMARAIVVWLIPIILVAVLFFAVLISFFAAAMGPAAATGLK